jgi:hypothetical protein
LVVLNFTIINISFILKFSDVIVSIQDALNYPIGHIQTGNIAIHPGETVLQVQFEIPSTATIGEVAISLMPFTEDPELGGMPYSPPYLAMFEIIQPQKKQYYLSIKTDPAGIMDFPAEGWYSEGSNVNLDAPSSISLASRTRYWFDFWDIDGVFAFQRGVIVNMASNHSAIAHYVLQYYLDVSSAYGTPVGEGWYDANSRANASLDVGLLDLGNGTRRSFVSWGGDVSGFDYRLSDSVIMDGPKTAIANWKTQYRVTFDYLGLDLSASGPIVSVNDSLKNLNDLPLSIWTDNGASISYSFFDVASFSDGVRFVFSSLTGGPTPLLVNEPMLIIGNYRVQYFLFIRTDPSGITSISGEGWYYQNETVGLEAPFVSDYSFLFWSVSNVSGTFQNRSITFYMDRPRTIIAHYQRNNAGQYIPSWFYWLLLLLLVLLITLAILFLYRRRKSRNKESFLKGWTAWYYGFDLLEEVT